MSVKSKPMTMQERWASDGYYPFGTKEESIMQNKEYWTDDTDPNPVNPNKIKLNKEEEKMLKEIDKELD